MFVVRSERSLLCGILEYAINTVRPLKAQLKAVSLYKLTKTSM